MKPKIVFSDFDGTLTHGLKLGPVFFELCDLLEKHEIELVVVSGRSLAWGHFLGTHTSVSACIMEGGGTLSTSTAHGEFKDEILISQKDLTQINQVVPQMLDKFPGLRLTSDSMGRVVDRAIELNHLKQVGCEKELCQFFDQNHVNYSKSSVHLNFWCGKVSKLQGIQYFLSLHRKEIERDDCIYFGDAPNDQEAFAGFKFSVGVSNLAQYKDQLKYPPKLILEGEENEGPDGVLNYLSGILKD